MRAIIIIAAALAACDQANGRRADPFTPAALHVPEDSTSGGAPDAERLDLPAPDSEDETSTGDPEPAPTSTGGDEATTTGEDDTTSTSTGSSGGDLSTSTGEDTSTGDETTTTGEPPAPPSECGDGVCDPAELADGCFAPGWCNFDCKATPECITPCDCTPEAAAAMNVCGSLPGACAAVTPGGYCDPNGDGDHADGDWVRGWHEWTAKCG